MSDVLRYPNHNHGPVLNLTKRCVGPFVVLLICAMLMFAGCAPTSSTPPAVYASSSSSSLEAPRTFKEWLATGYALNASVRRGAAAALNAKAIDVGDARRILADTDSTRTVLDEARKLEAVDPSTALGKVQYALGVLRAGEKLLNDRGVK